MKKKFNGLLSLWLAVFLLLTTMPVYAITPVSTAIVNTGNVKIAPYDTISSSTSFTTGYEEKTVQTNTPLNTQSLVPSENLIGWILWSYWSDSDTRYISYMSEVLTADGVLTDAQFYSDYCNYVLDPVYSDEAFDAILYTGNDFVPSIYTDATAINDFKLNTAINSHASVQSAITTLGVTDKVLDGWNLWGLNASGSVDGTPTEKAIDGQISLPEYCTAAANYGNFVLEPLWAYTVTYDANGGSGTMASVNVRKDTGHILPDCAFTPPAGQQFSGWMVEGTPYSPTDSVTVSTNITATAVWVAASPTVSTPVIAPASGSYTNAVTVSITCATDGASIYYTTDGTTPSSSSSLYSGSFTLTANATVNAVAIKAGHTDSAVATASFIVTPYTPAPGSSSGGSRYYSVKFNPNGGSAVSNQRIRKGNKLSEPKAPTKNGYSFDGWYLDEELTDAYDFKTSVTKDFTLHAKWNENNDSGNNGDSSISGSGKNEIILIIGQKVMTVRGEKVYMDVAPMIVKNRTMLPARFVAEALGATVEWYETEPEKVRITKDDIEIIIWLDSETAYVNGEEYNLDSPAFLYNDRTFVPVRFIAEELGARVDWEEGEEKVIIIPGRE